MSMPRPTYGGASSSCNSTTNSADDHRAGRPLRSKGLLPAIGVGAAVYIVTGFASITTLGLVGIGAGIGYGIGNWIHDKVQKKQDSVRGQPEGVSTEHLPWAVQVALIQWQEFVSRRTAGRQLTQPEVDQLWVEFEQVEPMHAMTARPFVRGSGAIPPTTGGAAATAPVAVPVGLGGQMLVATSGAAEV